MYYNFYNIKIIICALSFTVTLFSLSFLFLSKKLYSSSVIAEPDLEVILDVDTGSDDAEAILLMLSPLSKAKVHAITCVIGNGDLQNVTRNTLKTLEVINRLEIPVYMGSEQGLVYYRKPDDYFGEDAFGDMDPELKPPITMARKEHGASAMVEIINKNPGRVTVLCLAPLTNLALALHLDPELLTKTKDVYIMGGNLNDIVEFNILSDPEAAALVLSKVPLGKPIIASPHDVALDSPFSMDWRLNILGTIESKAVQLMNFIDKKILDKPIWTPDDAMLAACLLDPSLITSTELHHARVGTCGDSERGHFLLDTEHPPNVNIVRSIDIKKMQNIFLNYLNY